MRALPRTFAASALAVVATAVVACGAPKVRRFEGFACKGRHASYKASGGLAGVETSVELSCTGDVPRVTVKGPDGTRRGTLEPAYWEQVWQEVEGTGWRNLGDCPGPQGGDPVTYNFEVGNDGMTRQAACEGSELEFPYDALRNALDAAARELEATGPRGG